jgi:hypothetical protein
MTMNEPMVDENVSECRTLCLHVVYIEYRLDTHIMLQPAPQPPRETVEPDGPS